MAVQTDHSKLTIAAATIAAELYYAELTARSLTISAKNAAAIVLRAGNRAAGLSVISSFYDELAGKTIKLARVINVTAVRLSNVTVSEWRTTTAIERLQQASKKAADAPNQHCIQELQIQIKENLDDIGSQFAKLVSSLSRDLREIQSHMRAIDVVAVTSRLEAHRTGEFKDGLLHMAATIQQQANDIKQRVNRSVSLLDDALQEF